jgi:photosystem II stability/assembly factor-like uncharacterized protein
MNPNQVSVGGEYLKDSISVQVNNYKSPQNMSGFTVEFTVIKGGGKVDQQIVKTKATGKASTRWKLGLDSFTQLIKARVTSPEGVVLPETTFMAHGILPNAWNEIDIYPLSNLTDLATDTVKHISWMISSGGIYKRGDDFLDWQQLYIPKLQSASGIEIDKNGVIYVGTWNGELYKSNDNALSWIKCTNPILNRPYSFYFWITNDGDLWATSHDTGLYHSNDGGKTWTNPANGTDKNDFITGIYRLSDGALLSVFGTSQQLKKSMDNGKTWTYFEFPKYAGDLYVTEKQEIIVSDYTMPSNFYVSYDLGKSFKKVYTVMQNYATGDLRTNIQKFGSSYYIAVPGTGLLKTQDFEQFENIFSEPNIGEIYIDHTGTILVSGWSDKSGRTFIYNRN